MRLNGNWPSYANSGFRSPTAKRSGTFDSPILWHRFGPSMLCFWSVAVAALNCRPTASRELVYAQYNTGRIAVANSAFSASVSEPNGMRQVPTGFP